MRQSNYIQIKNYLTGVPHFSRIFYETSACDLFNGQPGFSNGIWLLCGGPGDRYFYNSSFKDDSDDQFGWSYDKWFIKARICQTTTRNLPPLWSKDQTLLCSLAEAQTSMSVDEFRAYFFDVAYDKLKVPPSQRLEYQLPKEKKGDNVWKLVVSLGNLYWDPIISHIQADVKKVQNNPEATPDDIKTSIAQAIDRYVFLRFI